MKIKLLLFSALAATLLLAGTAQAFQWHLGYFQAKRGTVVKERKACDQSPRCVAFGASCKRITSSRVDCIGTTWLRSASGEIECWKIYHWGVNRVGYIKFHKGRAHCQYA